jgi:uncharacterized protein YceK
MRYPISFLPLALFLALALSGCATMAGTFEAEPPNKIYIGVRQDLTEWTLIHGGFLDLPFSFIADTILLPYTIPKTIANYAADDHEPVSDGAKGEKGG